MGLGRVCAGQFWACAGRVLVEAWGFWGFSFGVWRWDMGQVRVMEWGGGFLGSEGCVRVWGLCLGVWGGFGTCGGLCGPVLGLCGKGFGLRREGLGGVVLGLKCGTGWTYGVGWWVFCGRRVVLGQGDYV